MKKVSEEEVYKSLYSQANERIARLKRQLDKALLIIEDEANHICPLDCGLERASDCASRPNCDCITEGIRGIK